MGVILRKWLVYSLFCIETKQHEKSKKKSIGITLYLVICGSSSRSYAW